MNPIVLEVTAANVILSAKSDMVPLQGTVQGSTATPAVKNNVTLQLNDPVARGLLKPGVNYLVTISEAPAQA